MNGRIDPSPTLGKENRESVGDYSSAFGLRQEHHLSVGECAQKASSEETIFTE